MPVIQEALPSCPGITALVTFGQVTGDLHAHERRLDFEAMIAGHQAIGEFPPRSGDDRFIIYTGGTTGMPKGVVWRQEDFYCPRP